MPKLFGVSVDHRVLQPVMFKKREIAVAFCSEYFET